MTRTSRKRIFFSFLWPRIRCHIGFEDEKQTRKNLIRKISKQKVLQKIREIFFSVSHDIDRKECG